MRNKYKEHLVYQVQDVFQLSFGLESFHTVVDKGTLDAVFPEDTADNQVKIAELFQKLMGILKDKGNLIIISLLQHFILHSLLHFCQQHHYFIQFYEVIPHNKQDTLVPFLVRIQKQQTNTIHLVKVDATITSYSISQIKKKIKEIQLQNSFIKNIRKLQKNQSFSLEIFGEEKQKKYVFWVHDSDDENVLNKQSCGVFITPQGKEQSFLFGTERGRGMLLEQTGLSRLVVVHVNYGFIVSSLEKV